MMFDSRLESQLEERLSLAIGSLQGPRGLPARPVKYALDEAPKYPIAFGTIPEMGGLQNTVAAPFR